MKSYRAQRWADFIQKEVSQIIREELRDPDLQELITISKVEVSQDLKKARIFYLVHGDEEKKKAVDRGFNRAKSYIRRLLASRLYAKFVPEIKFELDTKEEEQERLEVLFNAIRKQTPSP